MIIIDVTGGGFISPKMQLILECTKFTLISNRKERNLLKRRILTPRELFHICSYLHRINCPRMMYRMLEKHPYATRRIADQLDE